MKQAGHARPRRAAVLGSTTPQATKAEGRFDGAGCVQMRVGLEPQATDRLRMAGWDRHAADWGN